MAKIPTGDMEARVTLPRNPNVLFFVGRGCSQPGADRVGHRHGKLNPGPGRP
jgi:hypothetical protein